MVGRTLVVALVLLAGLFAPLVLGIWWKRTTKIGAISGMMSGFGICLFYLVMTRYWPA